MKLEATLAALSDCAGTEVDALRAALARDKVAASPPPVDIQLKQCQQFIGRILNRIEDLDKSREVQSVRLQEARDRPQRLQQEATARASVPPAALASDASPEVAGESINERTDSTRKLRLADSGGSLRVDGCSSIRHASRCRKWQCPRSQQVGSHVGRGSVTVEELDLEPSVASNTVGSLSRFGRFSCGAWCTQDMVFRGVRVGEALHPGLPLMRRLRRRRDVFFEISFDEDPLNVVPRDTTQVCCSRQRGVS